MPKQPENSSSDSIPVAEPHVPFKYGDRYPDLKEDFGWKSRARTGTVMDSISDVDHHGTDRDIKKQLGDRVDENFYIRPGFITTERDHLGRIAKILPISTGEYEHHKGLEKQLKAEHKQKPPALKRENIWGACDRMATRLLRLMEDPNRETVLVFNPLEEGIPYDPQAGEVVYHMAPEPWTVRIEATRAEIHQWLRQTVYRHHTKKLLASQGYKPV